MAAPEGSAVGTSGIDEAAGNHAPHSDCAEAFRTTLCETPPFPLHAVADAATTGAIVPGHAVSMSEYVNPITNEGFRYCPLLCVLRRNHLRRHVLGTPPFA